MASVLSGHSARDTAVIVTISVVVAITATAAWFRRRKAPVIVSQALCQVFLGAPTASEAADRDSTGRLKTPKADPYGSSPRTEYLSWDEYFMALAFLSAQRSKDPNKQVGAVLVSQEDHLILGIGYNGFPRGCSDNRLPWAKLSRNQDILETKYPYVCHAEMNAVLNKNTATLHGARMYVTMFCCSDCAKLLIQAGVREIIYFEDKSASQPDSSSRAGMLPEQSYVAARKMLQLAGVSMRQFLPKRKESCIRMCCS